MGILTLSHYFEKFLKLYTKHQDKRGEEVYEMLEKWHIERTGQRKCKDYDSFRSLKSQFYKATRT